MIEIRVNLGAFDMTIADLLELREGHTYQWQLEPDSLLSLYVGDEKIAHARLIADSDQMYVKIVDLIEN